MKPRPLFIFGVCAALAVSACGSLSSRGPGESGSGAEPRKKGYQRGETVTIMGIVTNDANQPVGELEVVFEASRHAYDYLRLRKRKPVVRTISTTTAANGAFELQWPWDRGFNRFGLVFGVTVNEPGGDGFRVLHREDLTRRIHHGSPVVSSVQILDTSYLESFLEFRASLDSEAQREVYREVGKPDKVRQKAEAGENHVDWWYFELGKVYRFLNGKLTDVENFEPVKPFDP